MKKSNKLILKTPPIQNHPQATVTEVLHHTETNEWTTAYWELNLLGTIPNPDQRDGLVGEADVVLPGQALAAS